MKKKVQRPRKPCRLSGSCINAHIIGRLEASEFFDFTSDIRKEVSPEGARLELRILLFGREVYKTVWNRTYKLTKDNGVLFLRDREKNGVTIQNKWNDLEFFIKRSSRKIRHSESSDG